MDKDLFAGQFNPKFISTLSFESKTLQRLCVFEDECAFFLGFASWSWLPSFSLWTFPFLLGGGNPDTKLWTPGKRADAHVGQGPQKVADHPWDWHIDLHWGG